MYVFTVNLRVRQLIIHTMLMYAFTVSLQLRQLIIHTILMFTHYASSEDLEKMLKNVSLSSFLSSILTRQEQPGLISDVFYYVKLLMKNFPCICHILFKREDAVHKTESIAKKPIASESQPAQNDANLDANDTMATDAEKKQGDDEEDETKDTAGGSNQDGSSLPQRQIFDHSYLKGRCALIQASRTGCHLQSASGPEKGLSRGSIRKHTLQLSQGRTLNHFRNDKVNANGAPLCAPGSTLKEISFIPLSPFLKNSPTMFDNSSEVLKIDYVREESASRGPTLEFYASTSKEFSKHSNDMWRGSGKSSSGHVDSINGYFPKHLAKSTSRSVKIIQLFRKLNQFVTKAMLYLRIIGILFNPAFFKGVLVKFLYRRQHPKRLL